MLVSIKHPFTIKMWNFEIYLVWRYQVFFKLKFWNTRHLKYEYFGSLEYKKWKIFEVCKYLVYKEFERLEAWNKSTLEKHRIYKKKLIPNLEYGDFFNTKIIHIIIL
jgi:hypothetical protein